MKKINLFILVSLVFFSCSNEKPIENQEANSYELSAKKIFENYVIIENEVHQNGVRSTLNQETVDYYASLAGYQAGEINLQFVIEVMDIVGSLEDNDFANILNQYEGDEFVKNIMITLSNGEWIENLDEDPQFLLLQNDKKELLLLSNAIAKEYSENGTNNQSLYIGRTHNGIGGFLIGTLIGCGIGGPAGCVTGAVIGGIVGIFAGHGNKQ